MSKVFIAKPNMDLINKLPHGKFGYDENGDFYSHKLQFLIVTEEGKKFSEYAADNDLWEESLVAVVWTSEDPTERVRTDKYAEDFVIQNATQFVPNAIFTERDVQRAWLYGLVELSDEWRGGYTTVYIWVNGKAIPG
jgi:hypothetical protein